MRSDEYFLDLIQRCKFQCLELESQASPSCFWVILWLHLVAFWWKCYGTSILLTNFNVERLIPAVTTKSMSLKHLVIQFFLESSPGLKPIRLDLSQSAGPQSQRSHLEFHLRLRREISAFRTGFKPDFLSKSPDLALEHLPLPLNPALGVLVAAAKSLRAWSWDGSWDWDWADEWWKKVLTLRFNLLEAWGRLWVISFGPLTDLSETLIEICQNITMDQLDAWKGPLGLDWAWYQSLEGLNLKVSTKTKFDSGKMMD